MLKPGLKTDGRTDGRTDGQTWRCPYTPKSSFVRDITKTWIVLVFVTHLQHR